MYGKHFESMYEGSMYGAGLPIFAVWGYVISHTRESRIELNPQKLADTLGGKRAEIEEALKFLMSPDAKSRHKEHDGARLVKEGEFQYFVPSWVEYQRLRDEADLREYNREAKRRERARKKGLFLPGEAGAVRAAAAGDIKGAEAIAAEPVPRVGLVDMAAPGADRTVTSVHEPEPPGPAAAGEVSEPEAEDAPAEED